jgi:acyl-CoA thioesterase FadM
VRVVLEAITDHILGIFPHPSFREPRARWLATDPSAGLARDIALFAAADTGANVRYLKPTPIGTELRVVSHVRGLHRKKVELAVEVFARDQLVVTAEVVAVATGHIMEPVVPARL